MKFTRAASLLLSAIFILAAFPPRVSAMGDEPLCEILIEPRLETEALYGFVEGAAITYSKSVGYELVGLDGKPLTERAYDMIRPCSSGLYIAAINGKYGALNLRGKVMIPFSYDSLTDFVDGYAVSLKNGVRQIINLAGVVGSPLDYDEFELLPGGLVRFSRGGLWGLADVYGTMLAGPQYNGIGDFSDGLAVVEKYGRYGAIDNAGREVLPTKYISIEPFEDGAAVAKGAGGFGLINKTGEQLIAFKYWRITRYGDTMIAEDFDGGYYFADTGGSEYPIPCEPVRRFSKNLWVVRDNGFYGIVNSAGEIVLPPDYDLIGDLLDDPYAGIASVTKKSGQGYIDEAASLIVPAIYDSVYLSVCADVELVARKDDKYAFFDKTGKELVPLGYAAGPMSDGLRAVCNGEGHWGYENERGETVITFKYNAADLFIDGLAAARIGNTSLIIDKTGMIIGSVPEFSLFNLGNGLFGVGEQGGNASLYGVVDKTGKTLLPREFSYIPRSFTGQDFYFVRKSGAQNADDGPWGIMDCFGKLVLPAEYEKIIPCDTLYEDYGDERAMLDIAIEFSQKDSLSSGLFWIQKDGKWGLMRLTARADIPSDWAKPHVELAISAGIVPGSFAGNYSSPATRAEFCGLAVAMYEKIKGTEIPMRVKFTDTDDINVEKMAGLGIVAGKGSDKFFPGDLITREEAGLILSRLAEALDIKSTLSGAEEFSDMSVISDWARAAVLRVRSLGIMSGVGGGEFGPKGQYTREQCITTLLKVYDLAKK